MSTKKNKKDTDKVLPKEELKSSIPRQKESQFQSDDHPNHDKTVEV
jgi:hypothetical protein